MTNLEISNAVGRVNPLVSGYAIAQLWLFCTLLEIMRILSFVINALCLVILADAVLSWVFPATDVFPRSITTLITGPLYAPIHAVLNPKTTGNIDLAPLILLVGLQAVDRAIKKRSRGR
jgi:uncharacterized protein YggT (Ycf19 family)